MPNTTPTVTTLPDWVLTEEVEVTLVSENAFGDESIYLIACVPVRRGANNAIVLTFIDDQVLLNGAQILIEERQIMELCSLVDEAGRWASPDGMMPLGVTYHSVPYNRQNPETR